MSLAAAIDAYHGLLTPELATASWAHLTSAMRERQLYFGDRPLTTVLRPRLISETQYAWLQQGVNLVAEAARRVVAPAREGGAAGQAVRDILLLTPQEEALIAMHPGYLEPSAHSRMDTFLTVDGTSLQFVEYNAESPAAIAYEDLLSEVFLATPVMQEFIRHYALRALPARHHLLETLLASWREAGSPGGEPTVAIVDWYGLPTATEFALFAAFFAAHGLTAVICSPDELQFRDGQLLAEVAGKTTPVTIVFKRVLTTEFLVHYGDAALDHPLVQAYAAGACVIVNSFQAKLLHKKSLFALLSDAQFTSTLSQSQQAALAAHIPWTRVVRPGATTYQDEHIDLLPFIRTNRDRLLLKPNDEYGGKGITIGWEASRDEWEAALTAALREPFVVQERVQIAYEPYPTLVEGKVEISQRLVDTDPFLFGSHVEGSLCRLSTVTLLNVTAGGGSTVPVFAIEA